MALATVDCTGKGCAGGGGDAVAETVGCIGGCAGGTGATAGAGAGDGAATWALGVLKAFAAVESSSNGA